MPRLLGPAPSPQQSPGTKHESGDPEMLIISDILDSRHSPRRRAFALMRGNEWLMVQPDREPLYWSGIDIRKSGILPHCAPAMPACSTILPQRVTSVLTKPWSSSGVGLTMGIIPILASAS